MKGWTCFPLWGLEMPSNGIGPHVTKDTITDVWMSPFPSYEDMEIKD